MVGVNVKISKRHWINVSDDYYDIYLSQKEENIREKKVGKQFKL